jgi:photosystem II stability/assembly factor-like uncharacterized protein
VFICSMRKITLFLFVITLSFGSSAQWTNLNTGTNIDLFGLSFVNDSVGYVSGNFGTILKTKNGGKNWESVDYSLQFYLSGIHFFDSLHGYAVGQNGLIIETTDGGKNWTQRYIRAGVDLFNLAFFSTKRGIAVGLNGKYIELLDSGSTWESHTLQNRNNLRSVGYNDSGVTIIVGDSGTILRKTNPFDTFVDISFNTDIRLNDIQMFDNIVYITGGWLNDSLNKVESIFLKSIDSGKTYTEFNTDGLTELNLMYFINKDTGYITGNNNSLVRTYDGFSTFHKVTTSTNNSITNVFFSSSLVGYATTVGGSIMKTVVGGGWGVSAPEVESEEINIFPNPTSSLLYISTIKPISHYYVFSLDGRELESGEWGSIKKLDFSNRECGMYTVILSLSNGDILIEKVVVDR